MDAQWEREVEPGRGTTSGLSALLVIDVVESVRLMHADEPGQVSRWLGFVEAVTTQILPSRRGRLVKSLGDGMLMEFQEVGEAVSAASAIQALAASHNLDRPETSKMRLRAGVHCGQVVRSALDLFGTEVNLASRIASLSEPGEIVVSARAHAHLPPDTVAVDLGDFHLKHYPAAVQVYRVGPAADRRGSAEGEQALSLRPSVAVIPFYAGAQPGDQTVGELIADGVIALLTQSADLRVISRLSCSPLAGPAPRVDEIRGRLGADYVVSGAVQAWGRRVVASYELSDARTHEAVCADRFVTSIPVLLQKRSEPLEDIARQVHSRLLRREVDRARSAPLPTLASNSLLTGAIHLMHTQSRSDFGRARELLEQLGERHPLHGTPKAWLAKWFALAAAQRWAGDGEAGAARKQVELALSRDPENGLAWAIKGLLLSYVDTQFPAAEQACIQALHHNPNEALAWLFLSVLRGWQGRATQAVEAAEEALRLSPIDPLRYYFDSLAGAAMLGAGRYAAAIELSRRSIQANPSHLSTYRVLTMAQVLSGDVVSGRATASELLRQDPEFTVSTFLRVSPWRASCEAPSLAAALQEAGVPLQ